MRHPDVIIGNGVFHSCANLKVFSALLKETAQTHVFILSPSLLLNRLELSIKESQTLTTHNANRHCRVRISLLWDDLC